MTPTPSMAETAATPSTVARASTRCTAALDDDTYIVDHADDAAIEADGEGANGCGADRACTYALEAGSEVEKLETTD